MFMRFSPHSITRPGQRRTGFRAGICLLLLVGAGCSRPAAPVPALAAKEPVDVLAKVGDESITAEQFSAALARRRIGDDPKAKRALLDEMIRFRSRVQEARRRGYDRDPKIIAAYENLLANRLREEEEGKARAQTKVSPGDVEAYYTAHLKDFSAPAKVRAAVIFVEAPARFSAEARAERRAVIDAARVKAAAEPAEARGFGALAAEVSYDQATKYQGGDMGYIVAGAEVKGWEKPVVDATLALQNAGDLSDVITTDRGYYLIKLTEKKPPVVQPLKSMSAQIERQLTSEKERLALASLETDAGGGLPIKVYDERLAAVPVPESAKESGDTSVPAMPGR